MALDCARSAGRKHRTVQARRLFAGLAGICAAALIGATPLHALSCLPPSVARTLHEVATAPTGFVAATGSLSFTAPASWSAPQGIENGRKTSDIPAVFSGKVLTKSGFTRGFKTELTLRATCFGPWCATPVPGKRALVFLEQRPEGYRLEDRPCGGHIFYDPSRADLRKMKACYLKGQCPKP